LSQLPMLTSEVEGYVTIKGKQEIINKLEKHCASGAGSYLRFRQHTCSGAAALRAAGSLG
ncbi:hypothetical protein EVA_11474, partial [gut metagenome]